MKRLKLGFASALVAGVLVVPMAAPAEVVTQLIHFDDATNGWKWYSDKDLNFLFDPTNLQSSTLCADSTAGGNGSCVIEGKQGVISTMTRPEFGPQSQGSASKDPEVSGVDQVFTLDSFYFLLTGNGEGANNAITATGSNGSSFTFQLGGDYGPLPGLPEVTFYGDGGNIPGSDAGPLKKNTGYIASFGNLFDNVTWIEFSSAKDAQVRLDCVVATFDGSTTEPASGFNQGCGGGEIAENPVPAPGTIALLAAALLGAGAARRFKT